MSHTYTAATVPPGFWVLDDHAGSPPGALTSSVFDEPFTEGFADAFARYGVLGDRLAHIVVDGWPYVGFQPLTDPAEIGRRIELTVSTDLLELLQVRAQGYLERVDRLEAERSEVLASLHGLDDAALAGQIVGIAGRVRELVRDRFGDVPVGSLAAEYVWAAAEQLGWDETTALTALGSVPAAGSVAHTITAVADALEARHPDLAARLRAGEGSLGEVEAALAGSPEGLALDRDLDHLYELSVAAPSMRERPDLTIDLLRQGLVRREQERRGDGSAPSVPTELAELAELARLGQAWRDESQNLLLRWMGVLRVAALEAGARLVARGLFETADHAFDLDDADLALLLRGESSDALVGVAADRHRARTAASLASAPPVLGDPPVAPPGPPPGVELPPAVSRNMGRIGWLTEKLGSPAGPPKFDDGTLHGVAASPGCVEGRARVVTGPDDFADFQPGDVLICAITSPAWNPIIALAGAVVSDSGGLAGHTAITAREFGVPAVVGTKLATRVIGDGQLVRVDGSAGTVVPVGV